MASRWSLERDEHGNPASILEVDSDITERRQAQEELNLAHARMRRFVDANIVGIVIANATGEVIEANDYYLDLLGFTREEHEQGKVDWRAITGPEWLGADEKAIQELRERGTSTPCTSRTNSTKR